jgi:hypothetical protein
MLSVIYAQCHLCLVSYNSALCLCRYAECRYTECVAPFLSKVGSWPYQQTFDKTGKAWELCYDGL